MPILTRPPHWGGLAFLGSYTFYLKNFQKTIAETVKKCYTIKVDLKKTSKNEAIF